MNLAMRPRSLPEEVRARARVVGATLLALTDDTNTDVTRILGLAARWDGRVVRFEVASSARAVERMGERLQADESVAWHMTRSVLALARLVMRSERAITRDALDAPLVAAARALVASGYSPSAADRQVRVWLDETPAS